MKKITELKSLMVMDKSNNLRGFLASFSVHDTQEEGKTMAIPLSFIPFKDYLALMKDFEIEASIGSFNEVYLTEITDEKSCIIGGRKYIIRRYNDFLLDEDKKYLKNSNLHLREFTEYLTNLHFKNIGYSSEKLPIMYYGISKRMTRTLGQVGLKREGDYLVPKSLKLSLELLKDSLFTREVEATILHELCHVILPEEKENGKNLTTLFKQLSTATGLQVQGGKTIKDSVDYAIENGGIRPILLQTRAMFERQGIIGKRVGYLYCHNNIICNSFLYMASYQNEKELHGLICPCCSNTLKVFNTGVFYPSLLQQLSKNFPETFQLEAVRKYLGYYNFTNMSELVRAYKQTPFYQFLSNVSD